MSQNPFEAAAPIPATPAQLQFYRKLLVENAELMEATELFQSWSSEKQAVFHELNQNEYEGAHEVPKGQTSARIDYLKRWNQKLRATRPGTTPAPEAIQRGVYLVDGTVIRVYLGRQSGRMLAAEITADGSQYLGAASRFVKADQRLSMEDAAKYGQQFGICCVCASPLEDPVSVAAGIGPVCGRRYNKS